jgi:anti-sigma B factor antagonist
MSEDSYPVRWARRQAVVTLPEHIDVSNASQVREELLSVINRGNLSLIADLTATLSCDHAGVNAVVHAYQRSLISGTQLRLVVAAQVVQRVLSMNGLDRLIPIYPSLDAAIAAGTRAAVAPLTEVEAMARRLRIRKGAELRGGTHRGSQSRRGRAVPWVRSDRLRWPGPGQAGDRISA